MQFSGQRNVSELLESGATVIRSEVQVTSLEIPMLSIVTINKFRKIVECPSETK